MSRRAPKYSEETKCLLRRSNESHMEPAYLFAHMNERDADRDKFKWTQRLKPSSMSFDMCMEEYQDTCDKYHEFPVPLRMKFGFANAIHKYLADLFKKCPDIVYPKPACPERVQSWLDKVWSEVPIDSLDYKSKMVVDLVAKIKGMPVVVDWKTTWSQPKEWAAFCDKPIVPINYITQAASYVFHLNREKYYPIDIAQFGFAFTNLSHPQDQRGAWKEVWFDYSPFEKPIAGLWDVALETLEAKLAGKRIPCKNPGCYKHGKGVIELGKVNPWKPVTPSIVQEVENFELTGKYSSDDLRRNSP